jgi:hypothetical protein
MKQFSRDVTHKYAYGILFMLLCTAVLPHTYVSVMAYFFLVTMIGALVGYILQQPRVIMISNGLGTIFTLCIALGILIDNWKWWI